MIAILAACAPSASPAATPGAPAALAPTLTPAPATPTPSAQTRRDARGVEQVRVPAGCFQMGTADITPLKFPSRATGEQPQHEVCITRDYWIDRYEVTFASFQAFVDDDGYTSDEYWSAEGLNWRGAAHSAPIPMDKCWPTLTQDSPRLCVTWYEAEAYAAWRGGRLPTEAEWEYAARGPEAPVYPWGDAWDAAQANVVPSDGPTAVGSYPGGVSWVGAHDMAGNAMEWVQDWLDLNYYKQNVRDDPPGAATGTRKVERGGWWGSDPFYARSAYRHFEDPPSYQDEHIGFRIVSPFTIEP